MALGNEAGRPGLSILRRIELETLYGVGEILSRTLDFRHTLREVLRTLVSRFPDHALATTAARQLSGETGASPAPSGTSTTNTAPRSAGGALSAKA